MRVLLTGVPTAADAGTLAGRPRGVAV